MADNVKSDTLIYKSGRNITEAVRAQFISSYESKNPEVVVKKAAYILRKVILAMEKKHFEETLSVESILSDTHDFPELLKCFLEAFFHGPLFKSSRTKFTTRMKSIGADLVFSFSHGKFIPAKHLGLGFKSITGKKEVLRILNRFGYGIKYWLAEELETRIMIIN